MIFLNPKHRNPKNPEQTGKQPLSTQAQDKTRMKIFSDVYKSFTTYDEHMSAHYKHSQEASKKDVSESPKGTTNVPIRPIKLENKMLIIEEWPNQLERVEPDLKKLFENLKGVLSDIIFTKVPIDSKHSAYITQLVRKKDEKKE